MNTLSGGQLAGGNSTTTKAEHDFYATDPQTTKLFLYEFVSKGTSSYLQIYPYELWVIPKQHLLIPVLSNPVKSLASFKDLYKFNNFPSNEY